IQSGFGRTGTLFAFQYDFQDDGSRPDLLCLAKSMGGGMPMGAVVMGERAGTIAPSTHGSTFGGNPLACAAGLAVLDVLTAEDAKSAEKNSRIRARENQAFVGGYRHTLRSTMEPHPPTPSPFDGEGESNLHFNSPSPQGGEGVRGRGETLISRAGRLGAAGIERLRASVPAQAVRDVRGRGFMIGVELRGKVAPVLQALQDRGVVALPAGLTVLRLLPPLVISDDDFWHVIDSVQEVVSDAV
ncbi:MAG: aminotransferase class III-fold pyridoxal phosphate-dependent enzyme, partial [Anaerolineae bacterium]|nr:aminotransferase class III-fold pyridoxal phosphate-dependent enzyme [Anaerolineae bacterium]